MSVSALTVAATFATQAHVVNHLPMPAWMFGVVGVIVVFLLLLVTWLFRHSAGVATYGKHEYEQMRRDAEHGTAHGTDRGATASGATNHRSSH